MQLLALWFCLASGGVPVARGEIQYVIAISVDGGRGDFIRQFIETAPLDFPTFTKLRALGASTFNARCDNTDSITIPNHLAMLTGRPVRQPDGFAATVQHGYTNNDPPLTDTVHNSGLAPGVYKASIFDVVHDHGLSTAAYLGKNRLSICERSWNGENGAPDLTGADNGTNKIDLQELIEAADPTATSTMVSDLVATIQNTTLKNFTFFHIADTDYAGHAYGWSADPGSPYRMVMRAADGWIGQIFDAVQANPRLTGKVALLLTADHGGGTPITTHLDPTVVTNYTIPFLLWAPGVPPGSDVYRIFENRCDPGAAWVSFGEAQQPMRNGDIANVAAALLGLPPVTGSLIRSQLTRPLAISGGPGALSVNWPLYLTGYTLEWTDDLRAGNWTKVTSGIVEGETQKSYQVPAAPVPARYYRLRAPVEAAALPALAPATLSRPAVTPAPKKATVARVVKARAR